MTMQERNITSLKINKHMVTMHKKQESLVLERSFEKWHSYKYDALKNWVLSNKNFHIRNIFNYAYNYFPNPLTC